MTSESKLGVTEARLGLSLLTCLLVALGYVVVQRLGDAGPSPPAEIRPDPAAASFLNSAGQPSEASDGAQILRTQGTESTPAPYPHTSQRPLWLAPQPGTEGVSTPSLEAAAPASSFGEPGPFEPQPLPTNQSSGATPRY